MKKIALFLGLVLMLAIVVVALASPVWKETEISRHVLLPRNINIIPPSADLPKEIAAFSGRWEGVWEGSVYEVKVVIVVEEIDSRKAKVIYGWSAYGNIRGDYSIYKAKIIQGSKPKIEFSSQYSDFSFEMGENSKIIHGIGKQRRSLNVLTMTMKKIEN